MTLDMGFASGNERWIPGLMGMQKRRRGGCWSVHRRSNSFFSPRHEARLIMSSGCAFAANKPVGASVRGQFRIGACRVETGWPCVLERGRHPRHFEC